MAHLVCARGGRRYIKDHIPTTHPDNSAGLVFIAWQSETTITVGEHTDKRKESCCDTNIKLMGCEEWQQKCFALLAVPADVFCSHRRQTAREAVYFTGIDTGQPSETSSLHEPTARANIATGRTATNPISVSLASTRPSSLKDLHFQTTWRPEPPQSKAHLSEVLWTHQQ